MKAPWLLLPVLSALVGALEVERRQNDDSSSSEAPPSVPSTSESSDDDSSTSEPPISTTSDTEEDTTVVVTTTVSGDAETVTTRTTRVTTVTSTRTNTITDFETTTTTERNQPTATSTIWETSTVIQNGKRDAEPEIFTVEGEWVQITATVPADAIAMITSEPLNPEMVKKAEPAHLAKRDTVFTTTTVTEGGDDATTTTETATRTIVTVDVVDTTSTETVTETEQADASTTVTVTSTRTVTSQEGGVVTSDSPAPTNTDGAGNDNGNNNEDGGLSTGAKAGIGAGAGVAGLLVIGALGWFCFKRRRSGPKPDHDDLWGSSEVPVGAGGAGGVDRATSHHSQPTMSQAPSNPLSGGGGYIPPKRNSLHQNAAMEGYRGTAIGDGRAGYAKPEPFGAAYSVPHNKLSPSPGTTNSYPTNRSSTLGTDTLPEHSTPAEIDAARGTSPPSATSPHAPPSAELGPGGHSTRWQNPDAQEMENTSPVYEMPGQNYR